MEGNTPEKILIVVVCLIILGVGIFAVTIFVSTTGMTADRTETFNVADPSVDLVVNLTYNPSIKPTAEQYNGIAWVTVLPADIEWSGTKQVIIEHEGMQG